MGDKKKSDAGSKKPASKKKDKKIANVDQDKPVVEAVNPQADKQLSSSKPSTSAVDTKPYSAKQRSTNAKEPAKRKAIVVKDFADETSKRTTSTSRKPKDDPKPEKPIADKIEEDGQEKPANAVPEDIDLLEESEKIDEATGLQDDPEEAQTDNVEAEVESEAADGEQQKATEELEGGAEELSAPDAQTENDSKKTIEDAMKEAELEHDVFTPDPEIDKAVDEIVRREGDTAIEVDDNKLGIQPELTWRQRAKRFFVAWWRNKLARYGALTLLFTGFAVVALVPTARYTVLNTVGIRVQASMTIVDEQTRLPLKNIAVSLQGVMIVTDEDGQALFSGLKRLKLGDSDLNIMKRGYADVDTNIVVGWGSNPLGVRGIVATGEQYKFALVDWLTSKPVTENAEAVAGENSATSNESGEILLTIGEDNLSQVEIIVSADGYRSESYTVADLSDEETVVALVSSRKHAFVSNRDGKYDVYAIDLDGKNEQVIVAATEKERDVPALLLHPSRNITALVSSRSGEQNSDGFKLDELYIVNIENGDLSRITRSEQLRIIGWSGDILVYSQVIEGTSAGNPQRSKLFSYNERTAERVELATANYFNDVELIGDKLYYAVSSFAVPQSQAKLYSTGIVANDSMLVIDQQVWNLFRVAYNKTLISAEGQEWFELIDDEVSEIDGQRAPSNRKFIDNPANQTTAWVEVRDGRGTILLINTVSEEERLLFSVPGLSELLYWVDETTLVYRVTSNSETADYLLPISVGEDTAKLEAIKIRDVTANQRYLY